MGNIRPEVWWLRCREIKQLMRKYKCPFPFLFPSLPLPFPSSSSPFNLSFALYKWSGVMVTRRSSHCQWTLCIHGIPVLKRSLCEYAIVHTKLPSSRVILWIELVGKPKWLLLDWRYYSVQMWWTARHYFRQTWYTQHDWHDTIDAVRLIVNVRWNRWLGL